MHMRRIISLVAVAMVMSALILASALPALAAPPTFSASCIYPQYGLGFVTSDPQDYKDVIAFSRNCEASGGTPGSRDVTPTPGKPIE
jgi:hypothetical protein